MVWPFGSAKSKHVLFIERIEALVVSGNFDAAYSEIQDSQNVGIFLISSAISSYRKQFLLVRDLLEKKSVDKESALAALANLKMKYRELLDSIEYVK